MKTMSVVIPAHNEEKYVARCIRSVKTAAAHYGGTVEKKVMEDVATAKALKAYGKSKGKKYTVLRKNVLINSTRKYDDMGDWLYLKLLIKNAGAFVKAAFGNKEELDILFDKLFYDYNG